MLLRQELEEREYELLDARASKALASAGREVPEEKCDFRTDYQRDRDRIIHSKAFRRLMHKTQVFLAPEGDHYRTRLTHTLEVAQVARTIARILNYNEDLTEAIALGLGRTWGIPVRSLARWSCDVPARTRLSRSERRELRVEDFVVAPDVRGLRVGLVDDVCTTGTTLSRLASACTAAGARVEAAFVLAHVPG